MNAEAVRARIVLEAYRRAYPEQVSAVAYKDDEWTITVRNDLYYWAHGRMLPAAERANWASFRPYVFYSYPEEAPDPSSYDEGTILRLREAGDAEERLNGIDHHGSFNESLYGASSRAAIERRLVKTSLFGKQVTVHRLIVDQLAKVDAEVREVAKQDAATARFLAELGPLGGYNWREIRGTARRSYHSWGLAVDVQPRYLRGRATFWEWERVRNDDWMLLPRAKRWEPPQAVIDAFERQGFVWGGKWELWDTMHFEYRPELLELRKVLLSFGGAPR